MNKSVNKGQNVQNRVKKSRFGSWLRTFGLALILGSSFLILFLFVGVAYVASVPVDLTPVVRYWFPIPVIAGKEKGKQAGFLVFDRLVMQWPIQEKGFASGITFKVTGLRLIDINHQVRDHLDSGSVTLRPDALWHAVIAPLSIRLSGADFHFKRDLHDRVMLDFPSQGPSSPSGYRIDLRHLYYVKTEKTTVSFVDEVHHHDIRLRQLDVNIHPLYVHRTLAFIGKVLAHLDVNGQDVRIRAQTPAFRENSSWQREFQDTGRLRWHVQMDQVNPAHFAGMFPVLHALSTVNVPVSAVADVDFMMRDQPIMQPCDLNLMIKAGQGKVSFENQDYYPSSGYVQIHADFASDIHHPVHVEFPAAGLQLRSPNRLEDLDSGPSFQFKGDMRLSSLIHPKSVAIQLDASSPVLDFSTLKLYWPSIVAKGAYNWITENMTRGQAHDFSIHVGLSGTEGWHHLRLTTLTGGIVQARDLEVYWLKSVPPLREMNARVFFVDPGRIRIEYKGGYQTVYPDNKPTIHFHKIRIPEGNMWITGLDNHKELGIITLTLDGKLPDLLTLLAEPRLRLLSRHPVPFKNPSGNLTTALHVEVPLKKKVKIKQVMIKAHNVIRGVHLDDVALGQSLQKAFLTVDVDTHKLDLSGKGLFSVFPVSFSYRQNFSHQNPTSIMEAAKAELTITPDVLKKTGFDMVKDVSGNILLNMNYAKLYDKQAEINLKLDLLRAELTLPIWHKEFARPAMVSGKILLDDNRLVAIRQLHAEGNGLLVQANMNVVHSIPRQLNIQYFRTGRSVGKATVNFPMTKEAIHNPLKGDIRISVKASSLDLAPFIQQYHKMSQTRHSMNRSSKNYHLPVAAMGRYTGPKGRHWIVNLQADRVYYNKDRTLGNVTAYMEYNGIRMVRMSYGMRQPILVTASLFPKDGNRQFYLDAQDLGKMLTIVGMSTRIDGGHLVLKGQFDDSSPEAPFTGKVTVDPFTVRQVPFALRQLSNLSIYGMLKDQKKDEMNIDALKGNLYLSNGLLKIRDGRVYNNALGATLQGTINLDQTLLDLQGTIVPVYAINHLLGHLPAVGKFLVPEKGGGVVAVPFSIRGKFADPKMDVYSSRVFMPGMLRQLF